MICLTVDNLGGIAEGRTPDPTEPSLAIGLPRILALFAECGVRATFFAEGYAAQVYGDALERIRSAGHELGLHAWKHERWAELAADREEELLARGIAAFERVLGSRPRGFRPPGGRLTDASPGIFARHGIAYVSTELGHARGLPGVPFEWARVDAYGLVERFGGTQPPGSYFAEWSRGARAHEGARSHEPWLVVVHPFCSGLDPHFAHFAGFVRALAHELGSHAFRTLDGVIGARG